MSTPRSKFLRVVPFELLFLAILWAVPAILIVGRAAITPGAMLLFLALLFGPHMAATVHLGAQLPPWSRGRLVAIALPATLWMLFTLPGAAGELLPAKVRELLLVVATVWGVIHVSQHNLAVLGHLRRRTVRREQPAIVKREQQIFLLLAIAASEGAIGPFIGRHDAVKAFVEVTQACLEMAAGAYLLAYLVHAVRMRRRPVTSVSSALFLISAAAVMIPWPIYGPAPSLRLGLFFLVINAHHSLASLWLAFTNRQEEQRRAIDVRELAGFLAPLVAVSLLGLWLATGAYTLHGLERLLTKATVEKALTMLTGCFVLHYYFEALASAPKRAESIASSQVTARVLSGASAR
jgi:hypothetical protein